MHYMSLMLAAGALALAKGNVKFFYEMGKVLTCELFYPRTGLADFSALSVNLLIENTDS